MSEIKIGKSFLKRLTAISDEFFSYEDYEHEKYYSISSDEALDNGEYFVGDIALQEKLSEPEKHSGFPEEYFAQPISLMVDVDTDKWKPFRDEVKFKFARDIGAHSSALLSYYPPGGFVGWHTNWNANAYQLLFTYSKDGNGYFRYWDMERQEIVTIQDKKGWQCRHYYFGRKDEPDHHCWHAAYAGGERMTLAYKFCNDGIHNTTKDEQARLLRDWCIDEIKE